MQATSFRKAQICPLWPGPTDTMKLLKMADIQKLIEESYRRTEREPELEFRISLQQA